MKTTFKISISVLMTLVFIIMPFFAFGGGITSLFLKEESATVELLQEGSFDKSIVEYSDASDEIGVSSMLQDDLTAADFIYQSLLECKSNINVYSYRININDITALYSDVINDHPDLFYVSSSTNFNYISTNNITYSIIPEYAIPQSEIDSAKIVFEQGARKALSKIDNSMTDLQKALVLHDYLCDIATYPSIDNDHPDLPIYHSAYGLFYDGIAVCAGNALTYSYLLGRLGINSEYVISEEMMHAWNAVEIDGNWYNVDITFDDINQYTTNPRGAFIHRCFMKSDSALMSDMGFYHHGMFTNDNLTLDDTTYDDYFWNSIDTNIYVINGDYYYLALDTYLYLYKQTQDGTVTKVYSSPVSYASSTFSGTYPDADGIGHSVSFKDIYSRLVYLDNRFYINSGKNIVSISKIKSSYQKNTILSLPTTSAYIVGLGIDDDEIVYNLRNSTAPVCLDKLEFFRNNISVSATKGYNNYADINLDHYVNAKDYVYIKNSRK